MSITHLKESLWGHCPWLQCLHCHVYSVLPGSFPYLTKVARPELPSELYLRLGDLVLVPGGVLQGVAPGLAWGRPRTCLGQLTTQTFA